MIGMNQLRFAITQPRIAQPRPDVDKVLAWAIVLPVVFVLLCAIAIFLDFVPARSGLAEFAIAGTAIATVVEFGASSVLLIRLAAKRTPRKAFNLLLALFGVSSLVFWFYRYLHVMKEVF